MALEALKRLGFYVFCKRFNVTTKRNCWESFQVFKISVKWRNRNRKVIKKLMIFIESPIQAVPNTCVDIGLAVEEKKNRG